MDLKHMFALQSSLPFYAIMYVCAESELYNLFQCWIPIKYTCVMTEKAQAVMATNVRECL